MTEETKLSALQENIARKGSNAYYYAHGKKIEGPGWDGREQPRLLSTEPVTLTASQKAILLESFSWMDDEKYVKIIVDFEGAGEVLEEDISLNPDNEIDALNFRFKKEGKTYALFIHPLNHQIESPSYRKKNDKFILKLQKKDDITWSQLKK